MPLQVTAIMLGVEDLSRSKKFYAEGLGCTVAQDYPAFVSLDLGAGRRRWPSTSAGRRRRTPGSPPRDLGSAASRSTTSPTPAKPWTRSWTRPSRPVAPS